MDLQKNNKFLEDYEDYLDSIFLINRIKNDSWEYFSLEDL